MLLKTFFTLQRLSHTNLSCFPKAMEAVAKESVDPFSANYNPVLGENHSNSKQFSTRNGTAVLRVIKGLSRAGSILYPNKRL